MHSLLTSFWDVFEDTIQQMHHWHSHQLAFASQAAPAVSGKRGDDSEKGRLLKLSSSQALLSKEPWKATLPTGVAERDSASDSTLQCNLHRDNTDSTMGGTAAYQHQWAMARVAVLVRPGHGISQLSTWMTHHLHVLPADALVLIDYKDDTKSEVKDDPWRRTLLNDYASQGIHVWSCHDTATAATSDHDLLSQLERLQQRLLNMQIKVLAVYQQDSAFLVPLQLHELLAVSCSQHKFSLLSQKKDDEVLVWDAKSLHNALSPFMATSTSSTTVDEKSSQLVAMKSIVPIPGDCPILVDSESSSSSINNKFVRHGSFPSLVCALTYAIQSDSCVEDRFVVRVLDKAVTSEASATDADAAATLLSALRSQTTNCSYTNKAEQKKSSPPTSLLVLLQMKHLDFTDWILYSIQQAADYGYTTDVEVEQNCSLVAKGGQALAISGQATLAISPTQQKSCEQWNEFRQHSFSLDKLHSIYKARNCQKLSPKKSASSESLISLADVLSHACG